MNLMGTPLISLHEMMFCHILRNILTRLSMGCLKTYDAQK